MLGRPVRNRRGNKIDPASPATTNKQSPRGVADVYSTVPSPPRSYQEMARHASRGGTVRGGEARGNEDAGGQWEPRPNGGWDTGTISGHDPAKELDLLKLQREELTRQQEELDRRLREEEMLRQRQEELLRREEELDRRLREEEAFKMRRDGGHRQRQEEEELRRRKEELDRRLKEEEVLKQRQEEELRKRQEEELRQRQEEEELMRREEEFNRRLKEEETLKLRREAELRQEELNRRLREEETLKMRREEEKLRKRQEEETFKLRQEEELRKRQEELDRRRKEEEKIRQRQEERRRKKEEEKEMALLRRQQEELKRRQEALFLEEKEMDQRLREKEDSLKRMQMLGYSSDHSSQPATKGYSSDYSSDSREQPAPSGLKHKVMTILKRRGSSMSDSSGRDIESQSKKSSFLADGDIDEKYSKPKPRAPARRGSFALGAKAIIAAGKGDRMDRAKVILRKIVHAIVTDLDDETLMRDDTEPVLIAITLLKEAMVGLLIAFAVVSLVLFIDHRFMMGLPTARNFRRATFHLMDDKETLKNFEENAALKFLEMEEYAVMKEEIAKSGNRTHLAVSILKQRSMDLENYERDMVMQVQEVSKMIKRLGMDKYCEMCVWNKGKYSTTCHFLDKAMEAKYQTSKFDEIFKSMKKQSCEKLEDSFVNSREKMNDFCAECEAKPGVTCVAYARDLSAEYGVPPTRAMARLMIKSDKCRMSNREVQSERLKHFCQDCMWDESRTCQQRAGYLMYKSKYSARAAILSAMDNHACFRKESGAAPELL